MTNMRTMKSEPAGSSQEGQVSACHAVLCANCEIISEANNGHCAACDSEALLSLSRILGGSLEPEAPLGLTTSTQVGEDIFRIRLASQQPRVGPHLLDPEAQA